MRSSERGSYHATICYVDIVNEINCEIMLVWDPWQNSVAIFFHDIHNNVNPTKHWGMWENLSGQQKLLHNLPLQTHIPVRVVVSDGKPSRF